MTDYRGKWVWSFQVQPDGSIANGQPFYRMETTDESSVSNADGMTVILMGSVCRYPGGFQICDQAGRVVAILNKLYEDRLTNVYLRAPR